MLQVRSSSWNWRGGGGVAPQEGPGGVVPTFPEELGGHVVVCTPGAEAGRRSQVIGFGFSREGS